MMEQALGSSPIKLVVGLGNPGKQYVGTRHNVGFEVLNDLIGGTSSEWKREKKWPGEVAKVGGVFLLKPLTFMNDSGRAVSRFASFYSLTPKEILVITDDVSLDTGVLRFRQKGSHGGQNGVRSIMNHLSTADFPRLKLGVGKAHGDALVGHVLGRFPPNEREEVENMLATASQAVQFCLSNGVEEAANRFNTKKKSPKTIE